MQGGSKMNTKNDPQIGRAGIVEMISWAAPPDLPAEHPLALTGLTTSAASMLIIALPSPMGRCTSGHVFRWLAPSLINRG
jgi:hypothetical protein